MKFETLADAVTALAKLAASRAEGPAPALEKEAVLKGDYLGSTYRALAKLEKRANKPLSSSPLEWLRSLYKGNPTLEAIAPYVPSTLIGGLGGAGVGGLGTMLMNSTRDERDKVDPLHGALMGGLAGGGLGFGWKAVPQALEALNRPAKPADITIQTPRGPVVIPGGKIPPDEVAFLQGRNNPNMGGRAWNFMREHLPISSYAVPAAAAYDAVTSLHPTAGESGKWGLPFGRIRPEMSRNPIDLGEGARAAEKHLPDRLRAALGGTGPVSQVTGSHAVLPAQSPGTTSAWGPRGSSESAANNLARNNRGTLPAGTPALSVPGVPGAPTEHLFQDAQRRMTDAGFRARNPGSPGLYRSLFGGQRASPATPTSRFGARLGYGLGIPAAELGLRWGLGNLSDSARESRLQSLYTNSAVPQGAQR